MGHVPSRRQRETLQNRRRLQYNGPAVPARDRPCRGSLMSKLTRRLVVLAAILAPLTAQAQGWPSGPIRIIVPFPPGGSVDALARLAPAGLAQRLGVTIVIENRARRPGSTGSARVPQAPPDGTTGTLG